MPDSHDPAVAECIAKERDLHRPAVRASAASLGKLLDPEFREISISGRLWQRQATIDALARRSNPIDQPPIEDTEMEGRRIADHLILLTYVSGIGRRRARRSSVWRLTGATWRLLHHQGSHLP
ncbi:MAG TPA: nuclear transport factor 2 family protein [Dermatophilaceae bacterium]|nr:nuclear transport factor 2 family protein [Dermatophilaceae bacterium]